MIVAPPRIAVFARYPQAGMAKTRMIPALGPDGAARLHRRLTEHTVAAVRASGLPFELRYTGAPEEDFARWLGDDVVYVEQGEGDLGERMRRATQDLPVILIGSDCPDLAPKHLEKAAQALETAEIVVGPARDGGYWLLGLARPMDFLFEDMEWGTDRVWPKTHARLSERAITPALLPILADCDRPEDLVRWPGLAR